MRPIRPKNPKCSRRLFTTPPSPEMITREIPSLDIGQSIFTQKANLEADKNNEKSKSQQEEDFEIHSIKIGL